MKCVILAGGVGSRLSEETVLKPKPMVEIGGKPILWHIMMHFSHHGFRDFVVALGYKGEVIKKYIVDYTALHCNLTVHLRSGRVDMHDVQGGVDWKVELIDTGMDTFTGGRIKRLAPYLDKQTFIVAYGDGVYDLDPNDLLSYHRSHGKIATILAVRPPARFGHLDLDGDRVTVFAEKPQTKEGWINGAVFVFEPAIFDYIAGDQASLERAPLERLARDGQLMAYRYTGFWQCMDTLRDKVLLEDLWRREAAPWKTWE